MSKSLTCASLWLESSKTNWRSTACGWWWKCTYNLKFKSLFRIIFWETWVEIWRKVPSDQVTHMTSLKGHWKIAPPLAVGTPSASIFCDKMSVILPRFTGKSSRICKDVARLRMHCQQSNRNCSAKHTLLLTLSAKSPETSFSRSWQRRHSIKDIRPHSTMTTASYAGDGLRMLRNVKASNTRILSVVQLG